MNALPAALFLLLASSFDERSGTPAGKPPVTGQVLFEGQRPEPQKLPAAPAQTKGCCPDGKDVDATDPRLVIDEKNGIANVLVTIAVPDVKCEPSKTPIVVDQKSCIFEPHCVIVPAGSKVVFKNSDRVNHNVRITALKNESSNDAVAPGVDKTYLFEHPDKVMVSCDYHPWMSSVVLVVDTPYAALTRPDGSFSIPGLAPGTYKARFWHEVLGRAEAEVVVQADGSSAPIQVKLAPKKPK